MRPESGKLVFSLANQTSIFSMVISCFGVSSILLFYVLAKFLENQIHIQIWSVNFSLRRRSVEDNSK